MFDLVLGFSAAVLAKRGIQATVAEACYGRQRRVFLWGLTFELTGPRRQAP